MPLGYALYFSERKKNRIVRWDPDSGETRVVAGGAGSGDPSQQLNDPYGLAINDSGELLVSDKLNHRICRLRNGRLEQLEVRDTDGHRSRRPDSPAGYDPATLYSPSALYFEKGGTLLVAFYDDGTIYRIHPNGRLEHLLGLIPNRPYAHEAPRQNVSVNEVKFIPLRHPVGIIARSNGTLFFIERGTQVVREYHPARGLRSLFNLSQMSTWFQRTEAPSRGRMDSYHPVSPVSLALDRNEELYLCDNLHGAVLKLRPDDGTFVRVVYSRRSPVSCSDSGPLAVVFGTDGTAWVANAEGQVIQSYTVGGGDQWTPGPWTLQKVNGEDLELIGGGLGLVLGR